MIFSLISALQAGRHWFKSSIAHTVWGLCLGNFVPLVGFAAVSGNTLTRKKALITVTSVWFTNQIYGFIIRQYPRTLESLTSGLVMVLGMLTVTWLVTLQPKFSRRSFRGYLLWLAISFVGGYAILKL